MSFDGDNFDAWKQRPSIGIYNSQFSFMDFLLVIDRSVDVSMLY